MAIFRDRYPAVDDDRTEDGPFVSFTDLFVGIIFLFLIAVAAIVVMQRSSQRFAEKQSFQQTQQVATLQEQNSQLVVDRTELDQKLIKQQKESDSLKEQLQTAQSELRDLKAKIIEAERFDQEHTPFRLVLAYNEYAAYQNPDGSYGAMRFIRSVRVFKSPHGGCIQDTLLEAVNTAWVPVTDQDIPSKDNPSSYRQEGECLTKNGEHYSTPTADIDMQRASDDLYDGYATLHVSNPTGKKHDEKLHIQYRVLDRFDDLMQ